MRIYIYAILIVFLVQGKLYSKVIKGVILNKTTNAVLPFASISIKNKYFGIVANENGEFDFHYKNEFKNDTLVISMLGFERFFMSINSFQNDSQKVTIALNPISINLNSIDVNSITADYVIKKVKDAYTNNYNTNPFLATCFFRTTMQENDACMYLIEASVSAYDKGFDGYKKNWKMPVYFVNEMRASKSNGIVPHITKNNGIEELNTTVHLDILNILTTNNFVLNSNSPIYEGDSKYYILTFNDKNEFVETSRRFVINANNWSIKEAESSISVIDKNNIKPRNSDSLYQRFLSQKFIIHYQEYQGKYYLSHIKKMFNTQIFTKNHSIDFEFLVTNEMSVNTIQTENVVLLKENKMNLNKGLYELSNTFTYHPEFWKSYNKISDNPEIARMHVDLDKKGDLEQQFKQVKTKRK